MTKQDILNMKTTKEINHTIMTNPELWDKEIRQHLLDVARKESMERFGSPFVYYDPPRRKRE